MKFSKKPEHTIYCTHC